ncbi:MAG: STAS domain-containing protein [Chitinophagaceae bacterium]
MEVKTSTKEKYHVISVETAELAANMTDELYNLLQQYLKSDVRNIVLNLENVKALDEEIGECLVKTQQQFYENEASFVICQLSPAVEEYLDDKDLLELLNATPTESEASDIVQMEEIERELLGEEDDYT